MPSIFRLIGSIQYNKGNLEQALTWFKRASEHGKPSDSILYGYMLMRAGEFDKADAVFQKLRRVQLNQEDTIQLRQHLALIHWKRGNLEDAIIRLESLFAEHPVTAVYASLGYMYIERGDLEKALSFNLEAFEYNSKNAIIRDNLGQTYVDLGEFDKAIEVLEPLMTYQPLPTFPECYYHFGLALAGCGQTERALVELKRALGMRFSGMSSISPDLVGAKIAELEAEG